MTNKKGQTGIILVVVGLVIAMILLMGVLIPVTKQSVTAANLTAGSVDATIANNLTTFILIGKNDVPSFAAM